MSNNEYHKDASLKDIRLRAQTTLTNIGSIVNSMGSIYTHTYIHTYIHIYIYIHTHIYIYIYIVHHTISICINKAHHTKEHPSNSKSI
jgi:hypothetical protein